MATIGGRLKKAIYDKGLKLTEFSKLTDVPYSTLQGYIGDVRVPGGDNLAKICAQLNVSANWLLNGKGEMYIGAPADVMPAHAPVNRPVLVEEIDENLEKLSVEQRQVVLTITQEMLKANVMESMLKKMAEKLGEKWDEDLFGK